MFLLMRFCLNLTYYANTFKFINMFPNIKRTKSQSMNHIIYIYTKNSQEYFINEKVQLSYVQCNLKEIKQPIPTQQLLKQNIMFNQIK